MLDDQPPEYQPPEYQRSDARPADDRRSAADPDDGERVAALMGDLERVGLMRVAIGRLPFGMPTEDARVTSPFGARSDPFRHRTSDARGRRSRRAEGHADLLDRRGRGGFLLAARRGYGNVVKIRHAFGFETVYAHLSKSRVSLGQRVQRGALIADMGSTGRSTGSHLHYEVRIDGQPINPIRFMGAARHVL